MAQTSRPGTSRPSTSGPGTSGPQRPAAQAAARLTRRGRVAVTVTAICVLIAGAVGWALLRTPAGRVLGLPDGPPCVLSVGGEQRELTREQAMTATTVAGVGQRIGASLNGVAAALDRAVPDPADGALTEAARAANDAPAMDPGAARAVYRALPDVARPGAASLARARALLGYDGPVLNCAVDPSGELGAEVPGASGLTPRAVLTRTAMREVFGRQKLGGFAPGGVRSGHIEGSAHYEGRAVDVFFRPLSTANTQRGWLVAQWNVAHAEALNLATVIFDRHIWSAARAEQGWRDYQHPDGPTDNPILLHRDHVHLDVQRGG